MEKHSLNIEWHDKSIEVVCCCESSEPEVRYYSDYSGYPGSSGEFYIDQVFYRGRNVTKLISKKDMESIKDMAFSYYEKLEPAFD
jgi:hypothetical protein